MVDVDGISISQQGGLGVAIVFLLDYLKRSHKFPWIDENTERLNKIISLAAAFMTAIGLHVVSSHGNIHTGGVITIAYPSLAVLFNTLAHGAAQFGGQEVLHKILGNHHMGKLTLDQVQGISVRLDQLTKGITDAGPATPTV